MIESVTGRVLTGRPNPSPVTRVRVVAILIALVVAVSHAIMPSSADSPARPAPFQKVAGSDGEYLFVMLTSTAPTGEQPAYPSSGLYRNDGSLEPLWTIDWYAFGVDVSSDGQHLVRYGPWASSPNDLAVAFYDKGRLIKEYDIESLVSDFDALSYSVSHFMWRTEVGFDNLSNLLRIRTGSDDLHLFDVTTGNQIISLNGKPERISAQVTRRDGSELRIENLHICWGGPVVIDELASNGEPRTKPPLVIALPEVKTIERTEGSRFRFSLRSEGDVELSLGERRLLCGQNEDQRSIMLEFSDIARVEIMGSASV